MKSYAIKVNSQASKWKMKNTYKLLINIRTIRNPSHCDYVMLFTLWRKFLYCSLILSGLHNYKKYKNYQWDECIRTNSHNTRMCFQQKFLACNIHKYRGWIHASAWSVENHRSLDTETKIKLLLKTIRFDKCLIWCKKSETILKIEN